MSAVRFLKTGASLMSGQGILVVTQLLLPPLFLRSYGVAHFGEWITLSAAAQYLGTLNFGLHNFANNQVTIHYNRGELDEANIIQATSFSMLLGIVGTAAALAALVFVLPVGKWLHLTLPPLEAAFTIFWLCLQLLNRMIFGFLQGGFLVIGAFHRGSNWLNSLNVLSLVVYATLAALRVSFSMIGFGQVLGTGLFVVLIAVDLRLKAPIAFPKFRYVRWSRAKQILRPSGYFGMLFSASFLVYQLPVIIMQRLLGPTSVVIFAVTRTVFSMPRQVLTSISTALGPEIVELYGQNQWPRLMQIYDLSERLVFALVPIFTFGTFLIAPFMMKVWLHKPLYEIDVCMYLALISAAAGIKEHKYQFQTAVNQHIEMARFMFFTYVLMVICMIPGTSLFGIRAFLALWLLTESGQIIYTIHLNKRLFGHFAEIAVSPLYRLVAILGLGAFACWWIALATNQRSPFIQIAAAIGFSALLLSVEYPLLKLGGLRESLVQRFFHKQEVPA
jgi:O-antigen/teichoic acid export membrane protein